MKLKWVLSCYRGALRNVSGDQIRFNTFHFSEQ